MTDKEMEAALKAIDNLTNAANELVWLIEKGSHPDAEEVVAALRENHFDNPADALACWSPK